ncbi:MAG: C4-dicarboxylate TRAP transporter large permease protein DctM [Woeseia sp.]|jgi:C4-dicarboxylate transporter DctM subunit|nr:MAG: C4-dicarboxylate TRAP transporter large permease protein DctM [Woeseia sp.]|tara:strand:+ start:354 stop:1613 length:1260 start_codon:yes stop_codon:yes gene_type:complete
MAAAFLPIIIIVLFLLRQNLIVILGTATAYAYWAFGDGVISNIVVDAWDAANKDILLSIPLFILAGNIMSRGGMASRLIDLMKSLTAPIPGGLAIATILSCAAFAAVSGSGTVTLLAIGTLMYPALINAGYPKSFALGALCAAGTLGIVVPPSIPLILYGIMTQTSIGDLFIAGIGPALLLTILMLGYAITQNFSHRESSWNLNYILTSLKKGVWALLMPIIILGGIYTGYFTATESAAVAVVYSIIVETFIHKEMKWEILFDVIAETTKLLGSLFPVLMIALSLNVFLTYEEVPQSLVAWMSQRIDNPTTALLGINLFLILIGCIIDIGSAILILAPMLGPIASAQGIDPVHFGIIMVMNLEIGYLTPPLGLNLIVAMGVFKEKFWTVCKATIPFLLIMLTGLLIVSFVPKIALFMVE